MSKVQQEKAPFSMATLLDPRTYDVYTKVEEDFVIQTSGGATLSLIGWIVMSILIISEVRGYFTASVKEHMIVDTTLGQRLKVNIDITFHAITCAEVNVDAMDVAGDNQVGIEHDMYKQRVDSLGKLLGEKGAEIVGEREMWEGLPPGYCGSCFGAETQFRSCCNSCDELKAAYAAKGWSSNEIMKSSEQCLRDKKNPFAHVRTGEGCRVHGSMVVNRVAGNFHVAHGESVVRDGRHIHQFIPAEAPQFNVSHTVHSLSFGESYPNMPANPLDGTKRILDRETGTGLFQYFIKVIPTQYKVGLFEVDSNQYTVTEKFRPLKTQNDKGESVQQVLLPGVFFIYDLSPFLIEVKSTAMPFYHLITRLFAIVGGVFTVLGVMDSVIYRVQKLASKKD